MKNNYNNSMTKEELRKSVKKLRRENNKIFESREKLRQASLELLEVDPLYAIDIKSELQRLTFANRIVTYVGAGGREKEINAHLVEFYLEVNYRIYIKEENVSFDFDNWCCYIKLTEDQIARIQLKNAVGIKSIIPYRKFIK